MENMSTDVRKFRFPCYIFDTCDVVYNWFISLLPPIVIDNLSGTLYNYILKSRKPQIKSSKVLSEGFYNSGKIYLLTKLPFSDLILNVRVNARRDSWHAGLKVKLL